MTESVWYYARGDVEKGPITTAQIKALVAAGKLRRDDFVWKEGMENWLPAGDVGDLFPAEKKADEKTGKPETLKRPEVRGDGRARLRRGAPAANAQDLVRIGGRVLFVAGLMVVLSSRGCDALSASNVTRLVAVHESAQQRFEDEWEARRRQIEGEKERLEAREVRTNIDNERLKELTGQANQLAAEKRQKQKQLEDELWHGYKTAAEMAHAEHRIGAHRRQLAFLVGSITLALGLLGMGFCSDGPERWISFILLAVIVYSLYAAGSVWDSVIS